MVETAVRHFFLEFFVGELKGLDFFGTVEICTTAFDNVVKKNDMEYATVPVRVHRKHPKVDYSILLQSLEFRPSCLEPRASSL